MATPGPAPSNLYQFPTPLPGYHSQPATPSAEMGIVGGQSYIEIDRDRMDVLLKNFHGTIGVLYSEKSAFYKQLASNIKGYYSTSLYFSSTEIINYDDSSWLDISARYTHLIFVGIPQTKRRQTRKGKPSSLDNSSREEELMSRDNRTLSTVVVINPAMSTRSKPEKRGHFLDKFLHIPLQQASDLTRLAQAAFAVFSGMESTGRLS